MPYQRTLTHTQTDVHGESIMPPPPIPWVANGIKISRLNKNDMFIKFGFSLLQVGFRERSKRVIKLWKTRVMNRQKETMK